MGACLPVYAVIMVTSQSLFSQQTFLLEVYQQVDTMRGVADPQLVLLAADVDWSEIHAVRLLGLALAVLFLLWAIRRMFGGKK
jgi:hypothetical protein